MAPYGDNSFEELEEDPEEDPENDGGLTPPSGQNSALYPPHPVPPATPGSGSLLSPSGERFSTAPTRTVSSGSPTNLGSRWAIRFRLTKAGRRDKL